MAKKKETIYKKSAEKKPINKAKERKSFDFNKLNIFVFALLCIIVFYPPFFRGLFFEKEFFITSILTSITFILWCILKINRKEGRLFEKPLDYALFGLVLAYLLSTFVAVNLRLAIGEFVKYFTYFMIYVLVSQVVKEKKQIKILLNVVILSGVLVALMGIGAASGIVKYKGAFEGGRIFSTLQYPNTTASFLMAIFFISLAFIAISDKKWHKALYGISSYTLLLTFIFTYSRGAWIMFPFVLLIYLIVLPKSSKIENLVYFIGIFVAALLASKGFAAALAANNGKNIWLWYFIGLIISFAVTYLLSFTVNFANKINLKVAIAVAVGLVVICVSFVGYVFTQKDVLVLSHAVNAKDSVKSIIRYVNVKPNTDYTLKLDLKTNLNGDKPWAYRITIESRDYLDQPTQILTKEGKEPVSEIKFRTLDNSKRIAVIFANQFSGTEAVFEKAVLTDPSGKTVEIPLKFKYIPENLYSRIQDINPFTKNVSERNIFYLDGLKIFKDYPILGAGGGAWETLYFMYQSFLYWTTEAHNFYLQLAIETGILGILALLFVFGSFIYIYFKTHRFLEDSDVKILYSAAATSIISLLMHASIDFDMSLGAVSILLWTLFGIITCYNRIWDRKNEVYIKLKYMPGYGVLTVIAFIFMLFVGSLFIGYIYGQKGALAIGQQKLDEAEKYFSVAVSFDPFTASYKFDLGQILDEKGTNQKNGQLILKAKNLMESGVKLNPYNSQMLAKMAAFYLRHGEIEKGLQYIEKSVQVQPLRPQNYQQKADAYFKVGVFYLQKGDKEKAKEMFNVVLNIPKEIEEKNKTILKPIVITDETKKIIDNANNIMRSLE